MKFCKTREISHDFYLPSQQSVQLYSPKIAIIICIANATFPICKVFYAHKRWVPSGFLLMLFKSSTDYAFTLNWNWMLKNYSYPQNVMIQDLLNLTILLLAFNASKKMVNKI